MFTKMAENSEFTSITLSGSRGHEPRRVRIKRYLVKKLALQKFGEVTHNKYKAQNQQDLPDDDCNFDPIQVCL